MSGWIDRRPERGPDVTEDKAPETGEEEIRAEVQKGISQVMEALQNGRAQDALDATRVLLERFPNEADPYQMLGFLLLKGGRPDQAVEALSRSIDIDDGFPGAHYNLGLALTALGRLDEAVAVLNKSLRLNGLNPLTLNAVGDCYLDLGNYPEALKALEKSLEMEPEQATIKAKVEDLRKRVLAPQNRIHNLI